MPLCPKCGKNLCTEQSLLYHLSKKNKCDKVHTFVHIDPIYNILQSDVDFNSTIIIINKYFKILKISKHDDCEVKIIPNFLENLKNPCDFVNWIDEDKVYCELYSTFKNNVCAKLRIYITDSHIYIKKTLWE